MSVLERLEELKSLGIRGALFRLRWEIGVRGLYRVLDSGAPAAEKVRGEMLRPCTIDTGFVANRLREVVEPPALDDLLSRARLSVAGRIRCFGHWEADFGNPLRWSVCPVSKKSWPITHWTRALRQSGSCEEDVKLTWEVARFPHAYEVARAAIFFPAFRQELAMGLLAQIRSFVAENPPGLGVHWASGQEIALRLFAWTFAIEVLFSESVEARSEVAQALVEGATHVERYLGYARLAVYNNHILSEALLLYVVGNALPTARRATAWRALGRALLEEQVPRQFYGDGGYIQLSHNYHRMALQLVLCACRVAERAGERPPTSWRDALDHSLSYLLAQQNPQDGRLPNYGANDGALPLVLTACDFSDFRPTLQAASIAARGERVYPPGPWDEEAAWLLGSRVLEAPVRERPRKSVSFALTGHHVLRGADPSCFVVFRCGTIRDRFSQIDMLHLDVWWRGQNVLVDGGSYLYNGPAEWHEHFVRTASHNTVVIDGRDQMLHYRRFKSLYWTSARLLAFEDVGAWALCAGEHYGYERHRGGCVHRRAVLFVKDDLFVVVDQISGEGEHAARLHWLAGDYSSTYDKERGSLTLETAPGPFQVTVFDEGARPLIGDVVRGRACSPRGWLSRYYGEKAPVPSLAVQQRGLLPVTFVSVLGPPDIEAKATGGRWMVRSDQRAVHFQLRDGLLKDVRTQPVAGA